LKVKILILTLQLTGLFCKAQNFQLKITGSNKSKSKIIDSIGYNTKQQNAKLTIEEINQMSEKLSEIGYIENQIIENNKISDASYLAKIKLRNKVKNTSIYRYK